MLSPVCTIEDKKVTGMWVKSGRILVQSKQMEEFALGAIKVCVWRSSTVLSVHQILGVCIEAYGAY